MERVIEECKRELCGFSIKTTEDLGWRPGRPYWRHHTDEPGATRWVAMGTGRGRKYLFSISDKDSGDNDDDEPLREKQSVEVWLPPATPDFCCHLDEQMQGAALPADTKAAIEKQVNEFHSEKKNASGNVNSLDYWAETSRRHPIVAQVARQCLCVPASSASSERSFSKTGHIVTPDVLIYLMSMSRSCLSYVGIRTCCNVVENVMNTMQVVQSDVMFSGFLNFEKCSNLL